MVGAQATVAMGPNAAAEMAPAPERDHPAGRDTHDIHDRAGAFAVDEAQCADRAGPCLSALDGGSPVAVPDVAATMQWPEFRDAAFALGLRASSIPLFAGRGTAIAGLNLYGRDPGAMAPLTAAVWNVFDFEPVADVENHRLDNGSAGLVAGIAGAFAVRAVIQQALGVIIADTQRTGDAAYLILRL
jgi:hypothetical protein